MANPQNPQKKSQKSPKKKSGFLQVAVGDFIHVGALTRSSPFTIRKLCEQLPANCESVVEYGPGDGIVTRALLQRLSKNAKITCIELNQNFLDILKDLTDSRVKVIAGNVVEWAQRLREIDPKGPQIVYSGVPMTFLSNEERDTLIRETYNNLRPGGRFVLYQHSTITLKIFKKYFPSTKVHYVLLNFPPYYVIVGDKP